MTPLSELPNETHTKKRIPPLKTTNPAAISSSSLLIPLFSSKEEKGKKARVCG